MGIKGKERRMTEKEREALMRLTMCARHQCAICKWHDKYTHDDCEEEITDDMHILMDAIKRKEE